MIDFTVLIPVYNTPAKFFEEAVNSILSQSVQSPHPIVIVNDGSSKTDTLRMIVDYQHDARFHVINYKSNLGTSAALNTGHEYIKSEYIALQGSDDVSLPDRFKKQVEYLSRNPHVDVLGTQLKTFWDHDPTRKSIFTSKHASIPRVKNGPWQINHGTVMYKNQAVKDVGGYDVEKRRGQDVYLWRKMMEHQKKIHNLSDILYYWRRVKQTNEGNAAA